MSARAVHIALLLVTLLPSPRAGAQALAPDGRQIRPGVDTLWSYLVRGTDTVPTGMVIDAITRVRRDGRDVLLRVYRSENQATGGQLDTLMDLLPTLAPLETRSYSARAIERIGFSASRATGRIVMPTGDSVRVDVALPSTVFNAASFDLAVRASPLAEGWRATVPAFLSASRTVVPMTARVMGSETVGGRACWRVEGEFASMPVTFWVAKDDRSLRRQAMYPRAGLSLLFSRDRSAGVPRRST